MRVQVGKQVEFGETARALGTRPQITVTHDARDHAAALVVPQYAAAEWRIHVDRAATAATRRFGTLRAPMRRLEPQRIEPSRIAGLCHGRRVEHNRAVGRGL
jgi:hypothetical protein